MSEPDAANPEPPDPAASGVPADAEPVDPASVVVRHSPAEIAPRRWVQFRILTLLIVVLIVSFGAAIWRLSNPPPPKPVARLQVKKQSRPYGGPALIYWVAFKDGTINYYISIVENGEERLFSVSMQNATRAEQFGGTKPFTSEMLETFQAIRRLAEEKLQVTQMPSAVPGDEVSGFPHVRSVELNDDPPRIPWSPAP